MRKWICQIWSPHGSWSFWKKNIQQDFPSTASVDFEIRSVHKSMEEFLSPAFYLTPPMDTGAPKCYLHQSWTANFQSGAFYHAGARRLPRSSLPRPFISDDKSPSHIRYLIDYSGYVEGWATYAENMSYTWTGLDDNLARCLQLNQDITLALYGRIDLGIHYEGWTTDDVTEFLSDYGLDDDETVHSVFRAIVSDPASYLPYCIGYMEFKELRDDTEETMGDVNLNKFIHSILNIGPCSFDVLEKYIQKDYIRA